MDADGLKFKQPAQIVKILQNDFVPVVLKKIPEAKQNSLMMFFGSAALGQAGRESDVDVMLFLPGKLARERKPELGQLSHTAAENFAVHLTCDFSWELINSRKVWRNDLLLHCLWRARALYDPDGIFGSLKKTFSSYPPEVLRDKIISSGLEIMHWLVRLGKDSDAGDLLGATAARVKLVKLNMVLLHLRHNLFFPSHKLPASVAGHPQMSGYRALVDDCIASVAESRGNDLVAELTNRVQKELVTAGLLPEKFYRGWEKWRQPLRYPLLVKWL